MGFFCCLGKGNEYGAFPTGVTGLLTAENTEVTGHLIYEEILFYAIQRKVKLYWINLWEVGQRLLKQSF